MFDNKKILILGMARSGYEAAKLLSSHNCQITINDIKIEQDNEHIEELHRLNISVILGSHPDDLLDNTFDYLIKNPGIKDDHKYIVKARELNIPVINEVELAFQLMPRDITIIGITGSNGKTTTTTLIYEILKKEYNNVHLTGNIGFPLSSFVEKVRPKDIVVMEVSIQQLLNVDKFNPNISVLTNLSEAHLDHVGSYDNYKKIKKKIFNNQKENEYAVLNYDDKDAMDLTKDIKPKRKYFSKNNISDCYIKNDSIYYLNEKIINLSEIRIKGMHNYENIMASIIVTKILNIKNENIISVLKEFKGVEHRIEYVKTIKERNIYNDSKSTNIVATKTALLSFNNPIILILGGLDRGQSFLELKEYLNNVRYVVSYGENSNRINNEMDQLNIKCIKLTNLEEATNKAYELSKEGDTILLSPGSASWDQFKDFEERGYKFKEYIDKLV